MPHTILEYLTLTKGNEYWTILIYMFLFISFWRFLTYKEKR
jgi:hypothetical protein